MSSAALLCEAGRHVALMIALLSVVFFVTAPARDATAQQECG